MLKFLRLQRRQSWHIHQRLEMHSRDRGEVLFQLELEPSPQLLELREKTRHMMSCQTSDYAKLVLQEHRFLLAKTQRLTEQFDHLRMIKQKQLLEIQIYQQQAKGFHLQMQQLFSLQIKQWYTHQQSIKFNQESKINGSRFLSSLRKLEEQYNDHQKNFDNRCPSQLIETLLRENALLKERLSQPETAKEYYAAIFKQILEIKENFERKIIMPRLQKREAAHKKLQQYDLSLNKIIERIRGVELTEKNILQIQALELQKSCINELIKLNQIIFTQNNSNSKGYQQAICEDIIDQLDRLTILIEAEQRVQEVNVPRQPHQTRTRQIRASRSSYNP